MDEDDDDNNDDHRLWGRSVYLWRCMTSSELPPLQGELLYFLLLASPYPRHPALWRQDTTFTWRLADAVTTLMFVSFPFHFVCLPPVGTLRCMLCHFSIKQHLAQKI